ncbi:flagellar filament capping protein FliD [Neomoorella carbonis]|uniref:flagellar filament capping protein FliD n=1 Tax=Neomoorella carbonis TaxID=3062783 RepID=UPI0038735B71
MTAINRVAGLATGIDTEKLIADLMKAERIPLDKIKQDKQIWQWKQEDYRAINTSLLNLRNEVFNLKLQGTFLVKKVSSSDENIVTATATSTASTTTYQVKVTQLATVATNVSEGAISGRAMLVGSTLSVPVDTTGANQFKISYDGTTVDISLTQKKYDGSPGNTLNDLIADIQAQIDASAIGPGKIFVSLTSDNQIKLAAAAKSDGSIPVIVVTDGAAQNALPVLGFTNGQTSITQSAIDPAATLWSQKDKFLSSNFSWNADHEFTFTINGQEFKFDGDTATLNSVIAAVNANTAAGVSMFYDPSTDKVSISTIKTGNNNPSGEEIRVTGGFMTDVLRINPANEQGGQDAVFEINGLGGMTSKTNTYTVNGVTFTFKGTTPLGGTATTVTVASDIDKVIASIRSFVDKYNETIASINAELTEARYPDYRPLTDEQIEKGKLTDKQIDAWQDKARSGLLKGDPLLSGTLTSMREALSSIVAGLTGQVTVTNGSQSFTTVANQLSIIGITTGSYEENGKLYLDENRLREALQSNPEAVMDLFTNSSEVEAEKGIAVRLYDAINNAMKRITAQAGSSGTLYDNSFIGRTLREIDERISTMEERLQEIEDRYWRQFTAMETAIARMNAQSAWLAQQFGIGGQ